MHGCGYCNYRTCTSSLAMAPVLRNGLVVVAACFSTTPALGLDLGGVQRKVIKIEPELDPESDKKFFGKDYPHDPRQKAIKPKDDLKPELQKEKTFDADYVKDENNDGGEWEAQLKYDTLRHKIIKQRKRVEEAAEDEGKQKTDLDAATETERDAKKAADTADEKADAAKKDAEEAEEALDKETASVKEAQEKVEKETSDLEECMKELADAREKLKKAIAERDAKAEEIKEEEANQTAARKAAEEAAASHNETVAEVKKSVAEEKEEYEKAERSVEEIKAEIEETKEKLKVAEDKYAELRKGLHSKSEPEEPKRSGAAERGAATLALMLAAVATTVVV